jgi:hypothetical protein
MHFLTTKEIGSTPERCNISIYTVSGKLVKRFSKDNPLTSLDWNLTNHANIPIASGVYLIHVDAPGVGERILKALISMRTVDLQDL